MSGTALIVVLFVTAILHSFCKCETVCNVIFFISIYADDTNVCLTPTCIKIASDLQAAIDYSVDPCDNFFNFACGKWLKDNIIPDERIDYSVGAQMEKMVETQMKVILENEQENKSSSKVIEMTKNFYKTCVDTVKINSLKSEPMIKLLNQYGGWPVLQNNWQDTGIDIAELIANMMRDYAGGQVFISVSVSSNWKEPMKTMLYIDQAALSIGADTRDYYINDTLHKVHMDAFTKYLKDVARMLAGDLNITNVNYTEIDDIIAFEKQLANITVPPEKRRNYTAMYNPMTIEQLSEILPIMKFKSFFQLLLPKEVNDFIQHPTFLLNVKVPKYMHELQELLTKSNKKTVLNYIIWRLFSPAIKFTDYRSEDIQQDYLRVMAGRAMKPIRWKQCLENTIRYLDMPVGALYVREHFSKEDKNESLNMVKQLYIAMKDIVNNSDWMDAETKHRAILKISAMRTQVGYPDFLMDDSALDAYYNMMDYTPTDSYFELSKRALLWAQLRNFYDILKPYDRNRFEMSPAVVNAYYSPPKNSINFPAAILKYPSFQYDLPKYINYGATGMIIGHEITHGFDDRGSQYDNFGGLVNWWSKSTMLNFLNKTDCMIKQYSKYIAPGTTTNINGRRTIAENIADNGGLKEAYNAYLNVLRQLSKEELRLPSLEKFTNQQMFFISFAYSWCGKETVQASLRTALTSAHSPFIFRVNGVLENNENFANVFNCKTGTNMNPDPNIKPKCSVW